MRGERTAEWASTFSDNFENLDVNERSRSAIIRMHFGSFDEDVTVGVFVHFVQDEENKEKACVEVITAPQNIILLLYILHRHYRNHDANLL